MDTDSLHRGCDTNLAASMARFGNFLVILINKIQIPTTRLFELALVDISNDHLTNH